MLSAKRFVCDRGGNFAVITAFMATGLIGIAGLAIDYARGLSMATDLQDAVDAAALAVARQMTGDQAVAQEVAAKFVGANFRNEYSDLEVTLSPTEVKVSAKAVLKTSLTRVLGFQKIDLQRESIVGTSSNDLEVVFVLDTTGSMAGTKLSSMKTAVTRMVNDLKADAEGTGSQVHFGLVPFAGFVNVGLDEFKRPRSFVDTAGLANSIMSEFPAGFSPLAVYDHLGMAWKGCVEARRNGLDALDTAPKASDPQTLFVPAFAPDEPDAGHLNSFVEDNAGSEGMFNTSYNFAFNGVASSTGTLLGDVLQKVANNENQYKKDHPLVRYGVAFKHGVVEPRSQWSTVALTRISTLQGPNFGCDVEPTIPLTDNASRITNAVQRMVASGSTNLPEGMAWGMRLMSPQEPFTEARPVGDANLRKVVVFLTDGANDPGATSYLSKGSIYLSHGYLYDGSYAKPDGKVTKTAAEARAEMDRRTGSICEAIKANTGAELFTIQLEVNDSASSDLLRNCATNPDNFYDTRIASRLDAAFQDIRKKINKFRIIS